MSLVELPLEMLQPSPLNPRTDLGDIDELAETMANGVGVIQPITVRPLPGVEGEYEIVVGERRFRAAQKAGLKSIPVSIRQLSDDEVMRMQVVENLQRRNLSPAEEGKLFKDMRDQFGLSGADIGRMIGRAASYVTTRIQLLDLPEEIVTLVTIGRPGEEEPKRMTYAKARELVTLERDKQVTLAKKITEKGMTGTQVRSAIRKADEVETMIAKVRRPSLRKKLEAKYLHRVFDADVKPKDIAVEIKRELGQPVGPKPMEIWTGIKNRVHEMRRPYMENSFVREWKQGDRRFVQATIWMDFGEKIPALKREDHPENEFRDFEEADKFAQNAGGYCTGIVTIKNKKYWCIYVKP